MSDREDFEKWWNFPVEDWQRRLQMTPYEIAQEAWQAALASAPAAPTSERDAIEGRASMTADVDRVMKLVRAALDQRALYQKNASEGFNPSPAADRGAYDALRAAIEQIVRDTTDAVDRQLATFQKLLDTERERDEAREALQFVERWANHHAVKPTCTAEAALSCIQHYPPILAITRSYDDGKVPETRNPWAELDEALSVLREARPLLAELKAARDSGRVSYVHAKDTPINPSLARIDALLKGKK